MNFFWNLSVICSKTLWEIYRWIHSAHHPWKLQKFLHGFLLKNYKNSSSDSSKEFLRNSAKNSSRGSCEEFPLEFLQVLLEITPEVSFRTSLLNLFCIPSEVDLWIPLENHPGVLFRKVHNFLVKVLKEHLPCISPEIHFSHPCVECSSKSSMNVLSDSFTKSKKKSEFLQKVQ